MLLLPPLHHLNDVYDRQVLLPDHFLVPPTTGATVLARWRRTRVKSIPYCHSCSQRSRDIARDRATAHPRPRWGSAAVSPRCPCVAADRGGCSRSRVRPTAAGGLMGKLHNQLKTGNCCMPIITNTRAGHEPGRGAL